MYEFCMCECVLPLCVSRMCVRVSENVCMLLVHRCTYNIALFSVVSQICYIIF